MNGYARDVYHSEMSSESPEREPPNCSPGTAAKMSAHCSRCEFTVCVQFSLLCVHLHGINAEHKLIGYTSLHCNQQVLMHGNPLLYKKVIIYMERLSVSIGDCLD